MRFWARRRCREQRSMVATPRLSGDCYDRVAIQPKSSMKLYSGQFVSHQKKDGSKGPLKLQMRHLTESIKPPYHMLHCPEEW